MGRTKVGRNDRCPCGSGEKFKNCCEGKAQAGAANPRRRAQVIAVLFASFIGAGILVWLKGPTFGLAALGGGLILSGLVFVLTDPDPPRGSSDGASAIDFGRKR